MPTIGAGWLKHAVVGASTPKMSIIHRLKQNVGGFQKPRPHDVVHASDITKPDFCPRQWALIDLTKKEKKDEYISTALQATFDVGNLVGDHFAEEWLGEAAIGHWRCQSCGDQRTFCTKPKKGCAKQGFCHWKYVEVNFVSQEYGVSGSIDVMVDLGVLQVMAAELKILKVEDFEAMKFPQAEHKLRTELYLKLIADSDSIYKSKINLHQARVVYNSRGYGKAHPDFDKEVLPWKEYVVQRNDANVMPILGMAKQIKIFRESLPHGAINMPSGICTLPTDKYAKTCSMCKECFSGSFPATQPPLEL